MPSYWRDPDHTPLSGDEAVRAWADAAHDLLATVASHYNKIVSAGEFTRRIQDLAQVRTDVATAEWFGRVLQQVVHRCHATGEPPLTSLIVNPRDGGVGVAYAEVLRLQGLGASNALAREKHAAAGRLDCYLRYASDVPDNATAQLLLPAQRTVAATSRSRAAAQPRTARATAAHTTPDKPLTRICPKCFLETPLDGECQNCL